MFSDENDPLKYLSRYSKQFAEEDTAMWLVDYQKQPASSHGIDLLYFLYFLYIFFIYFFYFWYKHECIFLVKSKIIQILLKRRLELNSKFYLILFCLIVRIQL